jgi:Tfp pilus assembly pilus retraction ATPase PilT
MNHAARKHIRDRELHYLANVIQMGGKQGMHTMDDCLLRLYESGEITYETAINNSYNPAFLRDRIHKPNIANNR